MKEKPFLFYNVSVVVVVASDMVLVLRVFSVHNMDEDSSKTVVVVVVVVVATLAGNTVVVVVVVVEVEEEDMDTLRYTPMMDTKDQDHYCIVLVVVEVDDCYDYDSDDDTAFLSLPDDLIKAAGWELGDTLEWIDNKDGTFSVIKRG